MVIAFCFLNKQTIENSIKTHKILRYEHRHFIKLQKISDIKLNKHNVYEPYFCLTILFYFLKQFIKNHKNKCLPWSDVLLNGVSKFINMFETTVYTLFVTEFKHQRYNCHQKNILRKYTQLIIQNFAFYLENSFGRQ